MKRLLASALIIGVSTLGLAGCGEETKKVEEIKAPGGTTTTTESVKSSGENPPPSSEGKTAETPPK